VIERNRSTLYGDCFGRRCVQDALTINQVAAGRKNRLLIEICGTRRGLAWDGPPAS